MDPQGRLVVDFWCMDSARSSGFFEEAETFDCGSHINQGCNHLRDLVHWQFAVLFVVHRNVAASRAAFANVALAAFVYGQRGDNTCSVVDISEPKGNRLFCFDFWTCSC